MSLEVSSVNAQNKFPRSIENLKVFKFLNCKKSFRMSYKILRAVYSDEW